MDIQKINLSIIDKINIELSKQTNYKVYNTLNGAYYHVLKITTIDNDDPFNKCILVGGCKAKELYEFNSQLRSFLFGLELLGNKNQFDKWLS